MLITTWGPISIWPCIILDNYEPNYSFDLCLQGNDFSHLHWTQIRRPGHKIRKTFHFDYCCEQTLMVTHDWLAEEREPAKITV